MLSPCLSLATKSAMQHWRDFLLRLMKTVRFSHHVLLFFFFSFPSSCPIPWRHAKSLPCFKNAVVSFHWASCGIVSTEIALILSEPCPIQRLYPAWFLVTTAPGQKFSVFLVCHLQSWQFVLSCVSVCVYTYGVGLASHTLLRWWAFWVSCLLLHRIISIFSALCFYLAKKKRWLG